MKLPDTWTFPSLHLLFSLVVCRGTWVSRGPFHWQSSTWMPQCTKVTHFSPKLSLSTSPSSAFVPTCRFCCLLGCLSLCVPVRRSVETLFSTTHHSLYLTPRQLTGRQACTHTHTHTRVNQVPLLEKFFCYCMSRLFKSILFWNIWGDKNVLFGSRQHLHWSTTSFNHYHINMII